jgi:hypothetical protein
MQLHMAEYDREVKKWANGTRLTNNFVDIKSQHPILRVELDGMLLLLNTSKFPDPKYAKGLALESADFMEKHRVGKLVATIGRGAIGRRFRSKSIMVVMAILLSDSTLAFIELCGRSAGSHVLVDSLWPKMTALTLIADIHSSASWSAKERP